MSVKDKVVIVTGSSRGIGKAIALMLAVRGAKVVLCSRSLGVLNEVAEEIRSRDGGDPFVVEADISNMDDAQKLVKMTVEKFGRVDVLVNNAGITRDNLIMRLKEDDWDTVININLKGTFNCTKAVTRPMMKQRSGKIINITSVVGLTGNAGQANYAASKAGIIGLTKSTAKELASRGITANAVAPGLIETEMTEDMTDNAKEELMASIPLRRIGTGEDIANTICFLASSDADYITGQVIQVDGGMVM